MTTQLTDYALSNLVTALFMTGQLESRAPEVAQTLRARTTSSVLRDISDGIVALMEGSLDGNLDEIHSMLVPMALEQERRGLRHYAGVTWLNIADLERARGRSDAALDAAVRAIDALLATSAGLEVESARTTKSWALAHEGRWEESLDEMTLAESTPFDAVRAEALVDIASEFTLLTEVGLLPRRTLTGRGGLVSSPMLSSTLCALRKPSSRCAALTSIVRMRAFDAIATDRPHPCFAFSVRV